MEEGEKGHLVFDHGWRYELPLKIHIFTSYNPTIRPSNAMKLKMLSWPMIYDLWFKWRNGHAPTRTTN